MFVSMVGAWLSAPHWTPFLRHYCCELLCPPRSLGSSMAVGKSHSFQGILSGSPWLVDTQGAPPGQQPSAPLAGKPGEEAARARGLVDAHGAGRAPSFDGGVVTGCQQELLLLGAEDH